MERHTFFTRGQLTSESINEYVAVLNNLSSTCEFGSLCDDLVRDIFICGLSHKFSKIKERHLSEGDIRLQKALDIEKSIELATSHKNVIENSGEQEVSTIAALTRSNSKCRKPSKKEQTTTTKCTKCGQFHQNKCPAAGVKCYACGKPNYFAMYCHNKQQRKKYIKNLQKEESESESEDESEELFEGVMKKLTPRQSNREWNITVQIGSSKIICQIDTGAQANVMSLSMYNTLKLNNLKKHVKTKILTFSGEKLPTVSKCNIRVFFKQKVYSLEFYIINMNCNNIIGLQSAILMDLVKQVNMVKCLKKVRRIFKCV
ncbi:uncharacterized protein [Eurosta solidaginis]|uniref:uncharacterized protein n=1 Tax=Eurosta solidaginis TaxID=178769 RepID=UPI003530C914